MNRNKAVVGLLALLAAASAIGFAIMLTYINRDACLDQSGVPGGSCPALAIVNGERYTISGAPVRISRDELAEVGTISLTNSEHMFSGPIVYRVGEIDPTALLAADAADPATHGSPYLVMFGPNGDDAWPALCAYLPPDRLAVASDCNAP